MMSGVLNLLVFFRLALGLILVTSVEIWLEVREALSVALRWRARSSGVLALRCRALAWRLMTPPPPLVLLSAFGGLPLPLFGRYLSKQAQERCDAILSRTRAFDAGTSGRMPGA